MPTPSWLPKTTNLYIVQTQHSDGNIYITEVAAPDVRKALATIARSVAPKTIVFASAIDFLDSIYELFIPPHALVWKEEHGMIRNMYGIVEYPEFLRGLI